MSNRSVDARLPPALWKALVQAKGWTYRELAERWDGKTPEYISMIGRNPERPRHYDDAVLGLPMRRNGNRAKVAQILRAVALGLAWQDKAAVGTSNRGAPASPKRSASKSKAATSTDLDLLPEEMPRSAGPGYRYRGYLNCGDVVAVSEDLGEFAQEGSRGVIVQVIDIGTGERYRILFESGYSDVFGPDDIDRYLAATGLTDEGAVGYLYLNDSKLQADFKAGRFSFGL